MNEYKGIMPTKIELTLEQSQQRVSNDVLDKISFYDCYANIMCCMIVWIEGVRLSHYLCDCLERMGTPTQYCVIIRADSGDAKEGIAMDFVTKLPRTSSGHGTIWVIVERLTKSAHYLPMCEDYKMDRLAKLYLNEIVSRHGPELVQETSKKISQIKDRLKAARDCQKIYAYKRRKPLEFSVGDYVLLKVSPWKGVVRFGKKGKLTPRFVRPFEVIEKVGHISYQLDLPEELNGVHDTFHVSNLRSVWLI
nr:hypothetical protein [Tanacetum cinerariifolium]